MERADTLESGVYSDHNSTGPIEHNPLVLLFFGDPQGILPGPLRFKQTINY